MQHQISMEEYLDPFTGEEIKKDEKIVPFRVPESSAVG